jgi:hypothetical protein
LTDFVLPDLDGGRGAAGAAAGGGGDSDAVAVVAVVAVVDVVERSGGPVVVSRLQAETTKLNMKRKIRI